MSCLPLARRMFPVPRDHQDRPTGSRERGEIDRRDVAWDGNEMCRRTHDGGKAIVQMLTGDIPNDPYSTNQPSLIVTPSPGSLEGRIRPSTGSADPSR